MSIELQTKRLLLREFRLQDLDAIHAYASDSEVSRYTSFGPNTQRETQEFLQRSIDDSKIDPRANISLAIVERTNQRLIGSGGYLQSDAHGPQYMFGYVLRQDCWGKRYGTEVAKQLRDYAFTHLNAHRLWAHVFNENIHSLRILRGLHFRDEGCARKAFFVRGAWHDLTTFALLRNEWQSLSDK